LEERTQIYGEVAFGHGDVAAGRGHGGVGEWQCSHAQSPEAGQSGVPRLSASRVLRAGGDASTRVRLSNISTSSPRSVHQS
jgi:hypothetical protein